MASPWRKQCRGSRSAQPPAEADQGMPVGPSLTHCQDCDNEIPPARQALGGKTRCVPCQADFEQSKR
ncbi:TraR/DksA C4-type zinc finger protein [Pseudomonas sp. H3_G09]